MRINVKIPNSNGVAAGQTATFDMPIGRRYHSLQLQYGGTTFTPANMTEIRLIANGEVIHRYSGSDRDTMNKFDRMVAASTNNVLVLSFDRFGLYRQDGEEATAIQTGSADKNGVAITSFKMEIDIDGSAVAPTLAVVATQSDNDPKNAGPGLIRRIIRYSRNFTVAGINEISDFPKGTEGGKYLWLNRTFFFTANTLDLEVDRSNFTIFQRTAGLNTQLQANGVRTAQADTYVFDPTENGYDFEPIAFLQSNGLPYQDFRYKLNLSGGETIKAYVEYLGKLQG